MKSGGAAPIAAAMVIWATWGLFVRRLPLAPWALTAYVGMVSAAATAGIWVVRGGDPRRLWPRGDVRLLVLMGALFVVNSVCFLTAYERTTVANAVLSHYTAPVFVALLAPALLGERLLSATPASLTLAVAGMVLLLPEFRVDLHSRHVVGLALGTLSGAAYAGLILLARVLSRRAPVLLLIFFQNAFVALCLAPVALARQPGLDLATAGAVIVLGLVHATLAPALYLQGIRETRAQTAAVLGYLEPLAAVLLGAVVLGESLRPPSLLGGSLILAAGGLVAWSEGRNRKLVDDLSRAR